MDLCVPWNATATTSRISAITMPNVHRHQADGNVFAIKVSFEVKFISQNFQFEATRRVEENGTDKGTSNLQSNDNQPTKVSVHAVSAVPQEADRLENAEVLQQSFRRRQLDLLHREAWSLGIAGPVGTIHERSEHSLAQLDAFVHRVHHLGRQIKILR